MIYRKEIDGLRAVAVIPVILFHAGSTLFSGGFVGVDIFFVISGYLITSIILQEIDEGKFSLRIFYERRARRILPALLFLLAVCLPFAWLWLTPADLSNFSKSLIGAVTFSSNIIFWRETGYFKPESELMPLLHTWSLAVEEQYYILFPLGLVAAIKLGKQFALVLISLMFAVSLAGAHWGAHNMPAATFYLLPMRAWEILIGAIVAFCLAKSSPSLDQKSVPSEALSFLGLALIAYALFLFDKETPFPSLYTLVPTIGAALIICFASRGTFVQMLLSAKPLVAVGLLSYSAYLWHQPIFAFAKHRSLVEPSQPFMMLLSLAAIGAGFISWKYVERPFRRGTTISRKKIINSLFFLSVFFALVGLVGKLNDGFNSRKIKDRTFAEIESQLQVNYGLSADCEDKFTESDSCATDDEPVAVLWGDSFAMHLAQSLQHSDTRISFRQHTASSCRPIMNVSVLGGARWTKSWAESCIDHNRKVFDWIKNNPGVKYVVLSSPFVFPGRTILETGREVSNNPEIIRSHLIETINNVRSIGKKVVIISAPPNNGENLGDCFYKSLRFGFAAEECDFEASDFSRNTIDGYSLLKSIEHLVPVIWLDKMICQDGVCKVSEKGMPIYRDGGHLSLVGSAKIGQEFDIGSYVIDESY